MNRPSLDQSDHTIGNIQEFKQLFNEHKKHVFAIALSILRDFELAEDVLQEVFIKLFQHMKRNDISNVKGWLIRVSRNTALDLYRKKKREITGFGSDYFDRVPYRSEDPLDKLVLSKYLELLGTEEREVVILKDITGLKHKEIAQITDLPLGTVLWKYNIALKKLKKGIE
ncbi:RNA polymerase sigma factor [Bacillus sp. Marseille-Q3570]|uniref:RNA polymerase sigma factor n=1 Tax=Bacillus sp. Marseille-Q3570 TaxID=2963522 RepID=UPI0021B76725|nr:RNA polymerase sigma factor [Bacillus sp. Marseille-Q3570]